MNTKNKKAAIAGETSSSSGDPRVSMSSGLRALAQKYADFEFKGNFSAFVCHAILHYVKCSGCQFMRESITNNILDVENNIGGTVTQNNSTAGADKRDTL